MPKERERAREGRTQTCKHREREREIASLNPFLRSQTQKSTPTSSNPFDRTPTNRENPFVKPIRSHLKNPFNQTQKTHSIAPSQTLIALIAPPARSSHPSTNPPKTDRSRRTPKPIILVLFLLGIENLGFVLDLASLSSTQIHRPQPSFVIPIHQTQSPLSLNLTGFDEFFLLGFVSFVFIY